MNAHQQAGAYAIAKAVAEGGLARSLGVERLNREFGVNASSAKDLIYVYRKMSEGAPFKRALSFSDLEYFLRRIADSEGSARLSTALDALRLHVAYRESCGVNQSGAQSILEKYETHLQAMVGDTIDPARLHLKFWRASSCACDASNRHEIAVAASAA